LRCWVASLELWKHSTNHACEKLSEELKKLDKNHSKGKELAERLRQKQEQVAALRKKQAELTRLTAVASRNESQISRLCNDVVEMKQKKVDLQKLITSERKTHFLEVQKLKKESMQKDRELNKVKKISDKKTMEAQKAQQVAKSRLEQMNRLKTKYRETDKRLRMQTVKRGVMRKAGLDPVMVGRRQSKTKAANKNNTISSLWKQYSYPFVSIHTEASPMMATKTATKVLFGMVVRERRRIASLARTASALDEKVQESEVAASAKDAAFRAYVDEQRLDAADLAQNQQEHILSLMDMVREEPTNVLPSLNTNSTNFSSGGRRFKNIVKGRTRHMLSWMKRQKNARNSNKSFLTCGRCCVASERRFAARRCNGTRHSYR
jgi:hypothetical protein